MSEPRSANKAAEAARLIKEMGGKRYDHESTEAGKAVSISISLPPDVYERLEAAKNANKKAKSGAKTISGLILQALEQVGY